MRVLIVEDEPLSARRLERFVREQLGAQLEVLHVAPALDAADAWLDATPADLVLLDLNLNGRDGFDLLARATASSFHTIVVSASVDQALRAFEHGVLDFVAKPYTAERLAQALARFADGRARAEYAARLLAVRKLGRVELVPVDDVRYVRGAGSYSELVLANGRTELHDKTLEKLLAVLPPHFERVHKSYLVDLRQVAAFHASEGSKYEVELKGGERLPVGRERWKELKTRWA